MLLRLIIVRRHNAQVTYHEVAAHHEETRRHVEDLRHGELVWLQLPRCEFREVLVYDALGEQVASAPVLSLALHRKDKSRSFCYCVRQRV